MGHQCYWWCVYGHFSPGENNLPCTGEVIEYYLALSNLSKQDLANALSWTERYIEMLKSPKNKGMPKLLPRRILLARTLHIPPILLGLSSVTLMEWENAREENPTQDTSASKSTMSFYERLLAVSWELYYTSTVQKASSIINSSFDILDRESVNATGVKKDQFDAMRCRFLQLQSLVLRDRQETDQALDVETRAVDIAFRLKNAELIASALLRRARIYIQQKKYDLALKDSLDMLPYADLSRDPLKGKCYQMAGEAQGYLAAKDRALQEKSLHYFKVAAQIARKGKLEPDGSFAKTDVTSVSIEQAKVLTLWGHYDEAHRTLAIARKALSPELTRWKVNLLLAEANVFFAQKDIDSCCYSLSEALPIIQAINLTNRVDRIHALCQSCKELEPNNVSVKNLEKMLFLSKVS